MDKYNYFAKKLNLDSRLGYDLKNLVTNISSLYYLLLLPMFNDVATVPCLNNKVSFAHIKRRVLINLSCL